jgi:hypothetical protein
MAIGRIDELDGIERSGHRKCARSWIGWIHVWIPDRVGDHPGAFLCEAAIEGGIGRKKNLKII